MFYVAPRDPRVLVPKRFMPAMGWTLNFARPASWLVLLALLLPVGAVALAIVRDVRGRAD